MKKRIIIWGGNAKPLKLETLDSHASVNAFFLTKYLKEYFEIINITDIDRPEEILNYKNIHSVISTAQFGFTNRVIGKGKDTLFDKIRNHVKGKLCSIADYNDSKRYYEDLLFCVRPVNQKKLSRSKVLIRNKSFKAIRSGWCAEPEIFYPEIVNENEINIFIDHAPYSSKAISYIEKYYKVLSKIVKTHSNKKINVYHQNDYGIVKWNFTNDVNLKKTYNRTKKVPYVEIAAVYRKIHIFCFTHKESAGLSGIEAAMCGAKLYIPMDFFGRTFIKKDLLYKGLDYKILPSFSYSFYRQFEKDLSIGINRNKNHNISKNSNQVWKKAADVIFNHIN